MNKYEFMSVCKGLFKFIKDRFCNNYLENVKNNLSIENKNVIIYVLIKILQMLHQIMPYVTESCWQLLTTVCDNFSKSILESQFN